MSSFIVWKINVKKFSITSQAIHSNFPVLAVSLLHLWFKPPLNCIVKSPTFKILYRQSPAFTYALTTSRYGIIFYMHMQYIFIQNSYSMGGALYSAIVRERLRMRKSLVIYYWQNAISRVKVNKNVTNINKLWRVSTSFVILNYFSLFHYRIYARVHSKKHCIIHLWQGSEYSSGSEYTRILNMLGLYNFYKKMLRHRCFTEFLNQKSEIPEF